MRPDQLIGLPYRLGADPEKHGAGDCLSLCRTVLKSYGISSPEPERSWYRRLKKKDYSIFFEELVIKVPSISTNKHLYCDLYLFQASSVPQSLKSVVFVP